VPDGTVVNSIEVRDVRKVFGAGDNAFVALDTVNVSIRQNEFFTLLGPSGCGKTTLLRLIAGFDFPTSGQIQLYGEDIAGLPPFKRPVNTVFQSYALFPHMSVAENIGFGLEMLGKPKAEIGTRVAQMLRLVRMEHLADRKTSQISGGQQQRVALARALAPQPKVLLLDEPLSALDYKLRKEMQLELKRLQHETGITFIFVTHDQEEALAMSDRIAVMSAGRILQVGGPRDIYDTPAERFVAEFIGETNLLDGTLKSCSDGMATVELALGPTVSCRTELSPQPSAPVLVSVRPERLHLSDAPALANTLPVRVEDDVYHGDHVRLHLKSGERRLVAKADRREASRPIGSDAHVGFAPDDCTLVLP